MSPGAGYRRVTVIHVFAIPKGDPVPCKTYLKEKSVHRILPYVPTLSLGIYLAALYQGNTVLT